MNALHDLARGELGCDLLQSGGLAATSLRLAWCCGSRSVTGQSALAGLQELLGRTVIHRRGDALPAAMFGDVLLAA
jgi:hypothetical protein